MIEDDVIREIRTAREAYGAVHGFDIRAMVADLQARDAIGDWPVVSFAGRPPQPAPMPKNAPPQPAVGIVNSPLSPSLDANTAANS